MEENPFVILKFLPTNKDPDTYFDVGLKKWICTDLDDEMCGKTYWPPNSNSVTQLVKTEESFKTDWPKHDVEVKRFYNTYPKARTAISGFLADSNYETEIEQGRGKRRKKSRQITSSDSDSNSNISLKLTTKIIPAPPPPVYLKEAFSNIQHCDSDSNSNTSSKLMKRNVSASSTIKLSEVEKLQKEKFEETNVNKRVKTKRSFSKHSNMNMTRKEIQTAKEIATSKMKRPKLLTSLSKTVKSPLKPVSSSVSISSSTSFNSLFTNSSTNSNTSAVQEKENLSSNVQSPMQDTIPEDNLFIDDLTLTQDSMPTDNFNRNSKNINSDSNCENSSQLSNLSTSHHTYGRKTFKEQLPDKNKEETLSLFKTKLDRTLVVMEEVSGKLDILNMNMTKLMRAIIPSEKRISRPEKMPALPLNTKQDLEEFNKFLEADHNLAAACHYMSSYMKLSVKNPERKSATNMLTKLLSNTLASEINCDGGNGKIAFKSLKLYDLFQGTLQIAFSNSDLIEANTALARWLKDAKWRKQCDGSLGNRKRKL